MDGRLGAKILLGTVICAAANVLFVCAAEKGAFGPVWPDTFLLLMVLAIIACLATLTLCVVRRVNLWTTLGSVLLLAAMAWLNYWAAWSSAAAC